MSDTHLATDTPTTLTPAAAVAATDAEKVPPLFRHTKRSQWGLGIVVRSLGDRLQLQFQDGQQRTFKEGYYHHLDAVDRQLDVTLGIVEALEAMNSDGTPKRARPRPIRMTEQIAYFRHLFPAAFRDDAYARYHRGQSGKRPLIRHRDALVARGQEQLSKATVRRALAKDDFGAVHQAACAVISGTDLVSVKERKRFAAMDAAHHAAFADSVHTLLFGTSSIVGRLDGYVSMLERALGQTPSWELTTILLGAVHPHDHVVVKERAFARQAEWSAPGLTISSRPMGFVYDRLCAMTRTVRDALVERGMAPRDLLDVAEFLTTTRKPKAQAFVDALRLDAAQPTATLEQADREAA